MQRLYYQPDGIWIGDIMPYAENGEFYLYHQRDTRNPEPFGEPFGWSLATTKDFINYVDFGESLKHGTIEEQDLYVYAGSVFRVDELFYAFYTGSNKEFLKYGKSSQVLLQATSKDGIVWEKSKEALPLFPQDGYDKRNWRDPFVLWDEKKQEYLLILGARKGEDKRKQTGRLVKFTSKDLKEWNFKGDFWSPGLYTMFEMPELFQLGEWWYLLYSEYSDKNKISYRMSKSLEGPFIAPKDEAFDGRAYYAGRTAFDGKRRVLFGWVPTKIEEDDKNSYLWGGTFVPHEIVQRKDGTLGTKPVDSLWNFFKDWEEIKDTVIETIDTRKEWTLAKQMSTLMALETTISFSEGTKEFSILFYADSESEVSYEYRFFIDENKFAFDKSPNYPWYQCFNMGLERPISLAAGGKYNIKMILDDTIATIYVNGVALNARFYEKPGKFIKVTVTNGKLNITNTKISMM